MNDAGGPSTEHTAHHPCAAPIAYSAAGAAAAVGLGLTSIRAALRLSPEDGGLPRHYLNSKPIILAEDLIAWVRGLPTVSTGRQADADADEQEAADWTSAG